MENRRNFVLKVAAGMSATSFRTNTGNASTHEVPVNNTCVHHVFFWLTDPKNQDIRNQFEKGLKALIAIPLIQGTHIGTPVESPRKVVDDSFTYSYMAFFKSNEDQISYQTHPIHLKFIEDCQHLWKKVVVYDAME